MWRWLLACGLVLAGRDADGCCDEVGGDFVLYGGGGRGVVRGDIGISWVSL